ncbi:TetR/AcrR family transcriptional regulator [Streptomyces drozdowiczii]|uniref:TetR/AcrR family transcriptional regulator n=1 Tax=Streptomyces drozdowiczii TaxID=202862 RepID=A0ABY6PZV3_9ACTN|nr:TetR/AcrR family transcriptional regulator [Streptomyces drozdowiczii]MCX0242428.1 TetR/AcrR family transcriptional regulator [Streptomyces drozdowiczii]UZK57512.1 TetR/AcrR family transcriptional regulator [Streptomyces drozdowiczii]
MSAIRGARERARIEVTAAIKDEARKQLAAEGAAKLSLRAVARELGMVSSALYRYFPSRDDLLTALIVDAYDAVGEAAERAAASPGAPVTGLARWVAVACAVRDWALAHPHEYALIYGSPVPGYSAPQDTVGPAARVGMALIALVEEARRDEGLALPPLPDELRPEAERLAADVAPGLAPAVAAPLVAAWSQLFGLISFEVFGQFNRVVEAREVFFRQAVTELARTVGLLGRRG